MEADSAKLYSNGELITVPGEYHNVDVYDGEEYIGSFRTVIVNPSIAGKSLFIDVESCKMMFNQAIKTMAHDVVEVAVNEVVKNTPRHNHQHFVDRQNRKQFLKQLRGK